MDIDGLKPETQVRLSIDEQLKLAGWKVQTWPKVNLGEGLGVVVREYPTDTGPADYLVFVNRQAVGVIEAKKKTNNHRQLTDIISLIRFAIGLDTELKPFAEQVDAKFKKWIFRHNAQRSTAFSEKQTQ